MQNVQLDEAQAGIKIARRNINNLRYAYDTTLIAESEQWLTLFWGAPKSLQMLIAAMKLKDTYSLEGKL